MVAATKTKLEPVERGLVEWYDFMDGKGTETTLKSRVSDNVLTLANFNFDENSGWTGKGLKFDWVASKLNPIPATFCKTLEIKLNKKIYSYSWQYIISKIKHYTGMGYLRVDGVTFEGLNLFANEINSDTLDYIHLFLIVNDDGIVHFINAITGTKHVSTSTLEEIEVLFNTSGKQEAIWYSLRWYDVALTPEEIQQNYEYEQSIDRTTVSTYPSFQEEFSYGIGNVEQLSDEQLKTFRLSKDRTKFVAGLRYCEGLKVEEYTYTEILKVMDTEEWENEKEMV